MPVRVRGWVIMSMPMKVPTKKYKDVREHAFLCLYTVLSFKNSNVLNFVVWWSITDMM